MRQRPLLFAILAFVIAGCSSSTGILPAGPDTYTVSERYSPIIGGGTEAERVAMNEANDFCQQHGRVLIPVERGESGDHTQMGGTGYSMTFRCLLPSDPLVKQFRFPQASAPAATLPENPPAQ